MKVLWITDSIFPEISSELKLDISIKGWVHSSANALMDFHKGINLAVASIYPGKELKTIKKDGIIHYLLPQAVKTNPINTKYDYLWQEVKKQFNPDVIHIHGSENPYTFSFIRACGSENVVVSIQGMTSVIERYYYGNIEIKDLLKSVTIRDLLRLDTVFSQRNKMRFRGIYEKLLIQNVHHIIGRTSWDRDHIWAINPKANYYLCDETLRLSFYNNHWTLSKCEKYSIFISQAYYPLKGLHQLIKALPIILKHYPETKVYVAGNNYFYNQGIRLNGFGRYINTLINKHKLTDHIFFTGLLSEEAMCQQFLNAHLFVCPSAIENSSNSVGEAQILGVPCIASYVGGNPDLITHGETGLLYRFEEYEMLAGEVCRIFGDPNLTNKLSQNGKKVAKKRHDQQKNATDLYDIYQKINTNSTVK